MKAKYYIGIFTLLLISSTGVITAAIEMRNLDRGNETVVINNYHGDYDFHYSSRINRFHRSYSTFSYYAPVFTDTYWYNYQPFSWGISIYAGGFGVGFGFNIPAYNYPIYNYPVYNRGFAYYNGWYDPWYYPGYDSYYYGGWYRPVIVNVCYRNNWPYNHYGWNSHNNWYYSQPVHYSYNTYNTYNTYNSGNSSRGDKGYSSGNSDRGGKSNNINSTSRREAAPTGSNSNNNYAGRTNANSKTAAPKREATLNNAPAASRRVQENSTSRSYEGAAIASKAPDASRRVQNNVTARSYENRTGNMSSMKNSNAAENVRTEARTISREASKSFAPEKGQAARRIEAPVRQERSSSMAMGSNNERQRSVSAPERSSAPARSAPAASQRKSSSDEGVSRTASRESTSSNNKPSGRR